MMEKVLYLENLLVGYVERTEELENLLKKEFFNIARYKSYPLWAIHFDHIRFDYNKSPENYIRLSLEWYADKRDFTIM